MFLLDRNRISQYHLDVYHCTGFEICKKLRHNSNAAATLCFYYLHMYLENSETFTLKVQVLGEVLLLAFGLEVLML